MDLLDDDWTIEFHSGVPAYKQIVHYIQAAIALGRLGEGDQLPTMRALHLKLNVNPNTVAKAYRELETAGVISTTQGSGCFVAPPAQTPSLSASAKKMRLQELTIRFVAEAKTYGIQFDELLKYLNRVQSHA